MKQVPSLFVITLLAGCMPFHADLAVMKPVKIAPPAQITPAHGDTPPTWLVGKTGFRGEMVNGVFQGKGGCNPVVEWSGSTYEECEYLNGFRVDTIWAKRMIAYQDSSDKSNASFWAEREQDARWRDEAYARRRAAREARQERQMEQAFKATAAAMSGDYSLAAAAGMPGADALRMQQLGNRAMSEGLRELSHHQESRRQGIVGNNNTNTPLTAEQRRVINQQQLMLQRAHAAAPAQMAASTTTPSLVAETPAVKNQTRYYWCSAFVDREAGDPTSRPSYYVTRIFNLTVPEGNAHPEAMREQWHEHVKWMNPRVGQSPCNAYDEHQADYARSKRDQHIRQMQEANVTPRVELHFMDWTFQ